MVYYSLQLLAICIHSLILLHLTSVKYIQLWELIEVDNRNIKFSDISYLLIKDHLKLYYEYLLLMRLNNKTSKFSITCYIKTIISVTGLFTSHAISRAKYRYFPEAIMFFEAKCLRLQISHSQHKLININLNLNNCSYSLIYCQSITNRL